MVTLALIAIYHLVGAFVSDRFGDFHSFYNSGRRWMEGTAPYANLPGVLPNLNQPILLPLWGVLTILPESTATIVWSLASIASAFLCGRIIARTTGVDLATLLLLLFASTPTFVALALGQVTFVVLLPLLTAAWLADRGGRSSIAGCLLGVLTGLKPFYGLYGFYLIWRRDRRAVITYIGALSVTSALGVLVVGIGGYRDWIALLREVEWTAHPLNASVWGVAARCCAPQPAWVGSTVGFTPLTTAPAIRYAVGTALAVAIVAIGGWAVRRAASTDRQHAIVGLCAVLLSPLGWLYYLPTLVGPFAASVRPSRAGWVVGALSCLPTVVMTSRAYGVVGTIVVGSWASAISIGLLMLVVPVPLSGDHINRQDLRLPTVLPSGR